MRFELMCIALCALLAVAVSWTRSPFMSLMYAVMLFINASVLLLVLGFEFLALVNLLVYVGALAVLFLFVIMLLEIPATELRAYARGWSTLALFGIVACNKLSFIISALPLWGGMRSEEASVFGLTEGEHSAKTLLAKLGTDNEGAATAFTPSEGEGWLGASGSEAPFVELFGAWESSKAPTITFVPAMESINSLGEALYLHYSDILILNSMVLTIALFGALVLAHIRSAS